MIFFLKFKRQRNFTFCTFNFNSKIWLEWEKVEYQILIIFCHGAKAWKPSQVDLYFHLQPQSVIELLAQDAVLHAIRGQNEQLTS